MPRCRLIALAVTLCGSLSAPADVSARPTREIQTEIQINGPPGDTWTVLTDFAAYPSWNPYIRKISGSLTAGNPLAVTIKPPGFIATSITPNLLTIKPDRELAWLGSLLLPGVFDGHHYFRIEPTTNGVRFIQGERFSGVAVSLLDGLINDTRRSMNLMNHTLKARVEARSRSFSVVTSRR